MEQFLTSAQQCGKTTSKRLANLAALEQHIARVLASGKPATIVWGTSKGSVKIELSTLIFVKEKPDWVIIDEKGEGLEAALKEAQNPATSEVDGQ